MVKFSNGMWWDRDGVSIKWAVESVKAEARGDTIRCVTSTRTITHRWNTINAPTITLEGSSPIPDVLLLKAYHWKAQKASVAGDYELFPGVDPIKLKAERNDGLRAFKTDNELSLTSNTLSLNMDLKPDSFSVNFLSHGVRNPTIVGGKPKEGNGSLLLTKLGWHSIGYVKDNTNLDTPTQSLLHPDKGEIWSTFQFHLSIGEKIFGLGERYGPFVKNGQSIEMWNEDGGTSSDLTYKNVPFYLSSRGYGIFIPCAGKVSFEVQSECTTKVNIAVPYESISAYIIHGPTPKEILEKYTLLTGRPALPPPWTFGLWLSTSFTTSYSEETVSGFLRGMEERDIPVDVFHFDCFWQKGFHWCDYDFDDENFPDAKGQLVRMKEKGYKICVWINPYIAQESKIFDEGVENGYFLKKTDGSVFQTDFWQAGMAWIDFTNPAACEWYQSKLIKLMDMGVDCFKTDFGERIPIGNVVYHSPMNMDATQLHNYYSFLYNKTTFEAVENYKGKNEALVFARSATAGCQRFPVHWGGDPRTTVDAMAETLRGGLSLGLCGFGFWAHDIGGFNGTPDRGLYMRWFAFGSLSSHSRLHGNASYRVPWLLDPSEEASSILSRFIHLKHSLMPYIYLTAIQTHKTGVPVMRPVFVEFPEKEQGGPATWTSTDTEYMLGSELLVMPVMDVAQEGCVQGYLPGRGRWWRLISGKQARKESLKRVLMGPQFIEECHGYDSLPLFLKPGGVIVMGKGWDLTADGPSIDKGRRSSAAYDWADFPTIVVNPFDSEGGDLNRFVDIPDAAKPGDIVAKFHIMGGQAPGSLKVKVVEGTIKGTWRVCKVKVDGELEQAVAEGDQEIIL